MVAIVTTLGPIILSDTKDKTEKSSGQVRAFNAFDSRLGLSATTPTYERIRQIIKDPTVQLARQAVVSPIVHTPWNYVETFGKGKRAPKGALDFIAEVFEPHRDWLLQNAIYGALDYGWAPFELVYKPRKGQIIIDIFKQLLQDFTTILVFVDTGQFAGFVNEPSLIGGVAKNVELLEPYACNVNLSYEGTDWYGQSVSAVLDPICDSWDDVQTVANRYDKKAAGATWVIYYPVGITLFNGVETPNNEIASALLTNLEASKGVGVPDEVQEWLDDSVNKEYKGKWRIELISASTSVQASFVDRQRYLDSLKIRAFGIPERAILEGKFGTKAEAETHTDIAISTIDTKHRLVCDQFNMFPVKYLMRLNYGEKYENTVAIKPAPLVDAQAAAIREIYRLIMQNPVTVEKEIQNIDVQELRDSIGIPTVANAPNNYTIIKEEIEKDTNDTNNSDNDVDDNVNNSNKE